jgi:hypothetical protein
VSYILDALKKAAEQRSGPPPEMRRLLAPAPVTTSSASRYVALGVAAAGVVAVGLVLWLWPAHEEGPRPPAPVASVASAPAETPVVVHETPSPAATDKPSPLTAAPEPRRSAVQRRHVPSGATATKDTPRARTDGGGATTPTRVAEGKPPGTAPTGAVSPAPAATSSMPGAPVVAAVPTPAAPAGLRTDVAKLKVEVIVYSEQRPLRWAFINGRKYVEGDAIGEGARVEEIQSGGVVLVEDGRRITLRP